MATQSLENGEEELSRFEPDEVIFTEYQIADDGLSVPLVARGMEKKPWKLFRPNFRTSLKRSVVVCFQTTIVCGVAFGILGLAVWWLDFSLGECCYSIGDRRWNIMPEKFKRIRVTSLTAKCFIINIWPSVILLPVLGWRKLQRLYIIPWNMLAAFFMISLTLYMHMYDVYQSRWRSYVGNIIFAAIIALNHWKVANFLKPNSSNCTMFQITFKISLQYIVGTTLWLLLAYKIIRLFNDSSDFVKALISSILPVLFALPRILTGFVIGRLKGIFSPGRAINFIAAINVCFGLSLRLFQANTSNFLYFLIVSFVHGLLNIMDKLLQPFKDIIARRFTIVCCFKKVATEGMENSRPLRVSRLIADQSLIMMMTETSSIIISCSAVAIIKYYYFPLESNQSNLLLQEVAKQILVAVLIEFLANIIAVETQTFVHNIPVIRVWSVCWKSILMIHFIQVFFAMIYFPGYIDDVIMRRLLRKRNQTIPCLAPFEKSKY